MNTTITNDEWDSLARYDVPTVDHISDVLLAIQDLNHGSCAMHVIVLRRAEFHLGCTLAYQATSHTAKLRKIVAVLNDLITERLN